MNARVHLPRVPCDSMLPGWSFFSIGGRPDSVVVRCAHCKSMGMLVKHSIEPNGEVNASIYCCEPGHIFAVLDDWPEGLRKSAEAQGVSSFEVDP